MALSRNKSILLGNSIKVTKYVDKSKSKHDSQYPTSENQEEVISDSGRLFLRNLSYSATETDLEALFKSFGPLNEVNLPIDKDSRRPKGFAFITFMFPEHALKAFNELDGSTFQGRLLHIIPGKPKEGDDENDRSLSFKDKKKLKEKQSATSSHNWNTLFLGSSAVADLVSDKYNVAKKDVLLGEGNQSAAVRLALGETQIVADTKSFLEEQGVSLDAFDGDPRKLSRSKTVILIKNLPVRVPVEEIRDKFVKYGSLGRVILPPNCVTALVEFHEPSEARGAFRGLAYSKFRDTPLFLEFAPEGALNPDDAPKAVQEAVVEATEDNEELDDEEPEPETTLFVKNLNFSTTESGLKEHFRGMGTLHEVTIAKKKDNVEGLLSMGFGFVRFKKKASADKALKTLQHKMLDDHSLELKKSERVSESQDSRASRKSTNKSLSATTKILVRNIPFEAHKKEIEDLFKTFGELKFVRLPKKVTGSHRGFAFVEYHTVEEAKKAFKALSHSTHLYGRRLVLEWAEQEESLESLRRKASREADGFEGVSSKRLKKSDLLDFMDKPKANEGD
ncbi:Putative RNAbinding protein 19like [Caligus rogercresseyi]|uniref:RNAbinding protein 19like n=1 Tax=Caligus rogercresseyi TaxID=217165 RepID=A0A7T8KAB0_CALRO|nr:Putative RNAbinding protein 19like [Caligus rogercresseyi]